MKKDKFKLKQKNTLIVLSILLFLAVFTVQLVISQAKYHAIINAGTLNLTITEKNSLHVSFNSNSGLIENMSGIKNYTIQNDVTIKSIKNGNKYGELPKVTPPSSNYEFMGWYTNLDNGLKVTANTIVDTDEDITLFAKWRLTNIKIELPSSFPQNTSNSPLVPNWTLNKASLKLSSNNQKYESILLTTTKSDINVTTLPADATIKTWYNEIGTEKYYIPTIPDDCKKVKVTMDEGYTNNSRKNPKLIFVQGNSPDKLIPNGVADNQGGQTDIPNTFGERQIVENPVEVYQIKNGDTIDLSPYWDDSYQYHALILRGYNSTSLSNITGATIEYIYDTVEDNENEENTDSETESEVIDSSIKVELPNTFPESSQSSPLVPSWTLGSSPVRISCNTRTYESILLTTTKTEIDVTSMPSGATEVTTWYNQIGKGTYYIPTIPNNCKKIRITMNEGYNSVNSRKNPKLIFVQGNSPTSLIPNGIADNNGGQTDIPNTFGERQIVEEPTEIYQIKNGSTIDLSSYWDDSYKYHVIILRGYDTSLSTIKGATIEYIRTEAEQQTTETTNNVTASSTFLGTVTKTVSKAFQGSLVDEKNNELYQFFDSGHCMVVDINTLETKREFDLPSTRGSGHYSSVEWLDLDTKLFLTTCCKGGQIAYASDIYVYDISDESNATITTLTCPEMNSDNYSYMANLAYDKENKLLYVGGYSPSGSKRNNLYISTINMSPFITNQETTVHIIGEPFTEQIYHMQDGAFYNGKIYYLVDSTSGTGSYNCFSVLEIDPSSKKIARVLNVDLSSYKEAENISIVSGDNPYIIMGYCSGEMEYYYKVSL